MTLDEYKRQLDMIPTKTGKLAFVRSLFGKVVQEWLDDLVTYTQATVTNNLDHDTTREGVHVDDAAVS